MHWEGLYEEIQGSRSTSLLLHTMAIETLYKEIAEEINSLCEEKASEIAEKVFGSLQLREKLVYSINEHTSVNTASDIVEVKISVY